MPFDTPITLIFNIMTLALSMGFLIIVVWYDYHRTINQFFATFLIFVQLWNVGFLLEVILPVVTGRDDLSAYAFGLSQAGFVGASISSYALVAMLVGAHPRRFRLLTTIYLVGAVSSVVLFARSGNFEPDTVQSRSFSAFFFVIFDLLALYMTWIYRRKLRVFGLLVGIVLFVAGQGVSFLNPGLGIVSLSATVSSLGTLIISFSIIQRELINPLIERGSQLEAMHEVSIAITQRIATDAVLSEIAERAAEWLGADASGILLKKNETLELVAIHNLPLNILHHQLQLGQGIAGKVAATNASIYVENYRRDWDGDEDLPLANETFGSVICVPLEYDNTVIGVLMVIAGVRGTLFERADVRLLELLASQAAVAISYGALFIDQKNLADKLELAHEQLETVLTSTDNPVVAVNRNLNLIFTNPAAARLFHLETIHSRANVMRALPSYALPRDYREALRSIFKKGSYRYEVELDGKTYQCHVASLGEGRVDGFVAILNDVSELKELDRIKSEMVRMTSHDLKNPLQAALSNLELLRDDLDGVDNDEISLSVDNIERQLERMNRIISGILDLERVRMGSNPVELCRPAKVVGEVVDELSDMAAEKQVELIVDINPVTADFVGDMDQFKRALINLVENAIKFNKPGGHVIIRVHNVGLHVVFVIRDNGIGIPQNMIGKVFDRFYRGHQPGAEHISGSGLGLSLVKAVVESHRGQIWVESTPGAGTTFTITVPTPLSIDSA